MAKKKTLQELANETKDCRMCKAKLKLLVECDGKLEKAYRIAIGYQNTFGGIVGHAFTSYTCFRCDEVYSHPNTGTPLVCPDCVKEVTKNYEEDNK